MAFRTQKISQMTPKGSDLEATDLIEVSTIESGSYVTRSITGQELIDAIPAPSVDWGDIGGTLSDQTDLNTALSGKVPTSRTLTINGTTQDLSADRTFTISTGITIGTTAITSGTVGRVLFEGTGNVVQQSSSLFWDNTNNRLGIGTSSPSAVVHSVGSVTASGAIARANFLNNTLVAAANSDTLVGLDINSTFTNGAFTGVSNLLLRASIAGTTKASITTLGDLILNGVTGANSPSVSVFTSGTSAYFQNYYNPTDNALYWQSVGSYHSATKMVFRNFQQNTGFVVFSNGNTALGSNPATVADAGFRLDVNGTARVVGQATIQTLTVGLGGGAVATNTALGLIALLANTTGTANTALGHTSLSNNTTGAGNTAIGFNSLNGTNGTNNSGLGNSTLRHITSGSLNTAVGAEAGRYIADGVTNLTTCDNSVFLGMSARPLANSQTNQIAIGHNAIGAGSNTATLGNTSIVDTILRGRINLQQYATGSRPTYVKGALIYDSTLSKLVVGGATGWEVVTSI